MKRTTMTLHWRIGEKKKGTKMFGREERLQLSKKLPGTLPMFWMKEEVRGKVVKRGALSAGNLGSQGFE